MSKINKVFITAVLLVFTILFLQENANAQDPKFRQLDDASGLVCMEAENYSGIRESQSDSYWDLTTEPEDFSGTGAMQAFPHENVAHKDINNAQNDAPVLEFSVEFLTAGTCYIWARTSHVDGYDDSVWFGWDEAIEGTAPLSYLTEEQTYSNVWYWISHLMNDNSDRASLEISEAGVHNVEIYMREPSFKIDKIVLTSDINFVPDAENPMGPEETLNSGTLVESDDNMLPQQSMLAQNYPNPFNPETQIGFTLNNSGHTKVQIFNGAGQLMATLVDGTLNAGSHHVQFNASDLNSGVYFYKIQSGQFTDMKKMILLK